MTEVTPEDTFEGQPVATPEDYEELVEQGLATPATEEPAVTETVVLEADGSVETIERNGGTAVSAAFRVAAGLDDAGE
jgi:hypothetical protein